MFHTNNRVSLMLSAFSSLGMEGFYDTILGTALPATRSPLQLDISQAGYLGSSAWLGFAIAIFAGGALSDVLKNQRALMFAC